MPKKATNPYSNWLFYLFLVLLFALVIGLTIWAIVGFGKRKCNCKCKCGSHKKKCPMRHRNNSICSCSNSCSPNSSCSDSKDCKTMTCCPKTAYLSVNGTGIVDITPEDSEIGILEMTWNDPTLVQRPCSGWQAVNGDVNVPTAVTGFTVPVSGNYRVNYSAGMITRGSIVLLNVNGLVSRRSGSWSLDEFDGPQTCGRQLTKTFMEHFTKGDIVTLIIVVFIEDEFFIDTFQDTEDFRYLTTMTLELVDSDKCNPGSTCGSSVDIVVPEIDGPNNGVNNGNALSSNGSIQNGVSNNAFFNKIKQMKDSIASTTSSGAQMSPATFLASLLPAAAA